MAGNPMDPLAEPLGSGPAIDAVREQVRRRLRGPSAARRLPPFMTDRDPDRLRQDLAPIADRVIRK